MSTAGSRIASAIVLSLVAPLAFAEGSAFEAKRMQMGDLQWFTTPGGFQRSNVAGDDTKPGLYAYRVKFPAGFRNAPHFHPDNRVVTVISGTHYVGYGETFDETKVVAMPPGSVWTEPAKQPHFTWAKDGEVMIHVTGVGPSGSTPVAKPQ